MIIWEGNNGYELEDWRRIQRERSKRFLSTRAGQWLTAVVVTLATFAILGGLVAMVKGLS